MDKQIKKLKSYQVEYLGKTKQQIIEEWGTPIESYGDETLNYTKSYLLLFRDYITFFVEEGKVSDIAITEYFLWIGLRNIFYFKDQNPEYRVTKIFNK